MAKTLDYVRTADGDVAVRIAHLVVALVPQKDGSMRTLTAWPARDPGACSRKDFHPGGFDATDLDRFMIETAEYAQHHEDLERLGRIVQDQATTRSYCTPWGTPDRATRYADGVVRVDCPGHGGFLVSQDTNESIASEWRNPVEMDGWAKYEEDLESAFVRHGLPHLFTDWERSCDDRTLRSWMPDEWERVTGTRLLPGQSMVRDRRDFLEANRDRWIVTSAEMARTEPGHVVVTSYRGGRDDRGRTLGAPRRHLLLATDYEARRLASGVFECLVEETDAEIGARPSEARLDRAA
jgi:hypothetical protein